MKKKSLYVHHQSVGANIAHTVLSRLKFSKENKNEIVDLVRDHLKDDSPLRKYDNAHKSEPKDL